MLIEDYKLKTVAIWIGTCDRDAEAEYKYHVSSRGRKAGIEKDLGWKPDLDWFLCDKTENDEVLPIDELVKKLYSPVKDDALLIETAKQKGVLEGNRIFSYNIAKFIEEEPNKSYCGLKFIGNFERVKIT